MPVLAQSVALKQSYSPAAAAWATVLLEDTFTEAATTDLASHTPDTNNTGSGWEDPAGKNPMEVLGTGHARSKYIASYTTGWGSIDLGVNDLRLTVDLDPYAVFYTLGPGWNMDQAASNGWHFSWAADSTNATGLYQRTADVSTGRDVAAAAAGHDERRVIVTHQGDAIAADFNPGEATFSYSSAYRPGTYAALFAARKDSGYHRINYLRVNV